MHKIITKCSFILCLFICILLLNACSSTRAPVPEDPYEGFNRAVYTFNDALDQTVLQPTARFYNKIMPRPLNKGVTNFFNNLDQIPTTANDILQGNVYQAASDAWRFVINSTIGIGGLFDVASKIGLELQITTDSTL